MNKRRMETVLMVAMLLIVNGVIALWLQGHPSATAWASALSGPAAAATIPASFSYQGTLRDATGALITGSVNLTLKLYKQPTGGAALHTESFANLNVRDGVFSVVVGDATPALNPAIFDNPAVYIGIAVNGDPEMLPRQRLHPVPWAMQASTAISAVGAQNLTSGGSAPSISGNVAIAGNLTVDGDLAVTGAQALGNNVTTLAIRDRGDSNGGTNQRDFYPVTINRYVVEAPDNGTSPDSVPVDDTILKALCQDEDGCEVTLGMRNWTASADGLLATVGPFHFSFTNQNPRRWHSIPASGVGDPETPDHAGTIRDGYDGDGNTNHMARVSDCYFTDTKWVNGATGAGDNELGFYLLNWHGIQDNTDMVCVLIIND